MITLLFRQGAAALRLLLVATVVLGLVYPFAVWGVTRLPGLRGPAEGSQLAVADGAPAGSALIGIDPVASASDSSGPSADPYFHTRPAASADDVLGPGDPSTSGGSNQGGFSDDLLAAVEQRRQVIAAREDVAPALVPADAVTASGSGVDPHISPAYADLQVRRVARVTGLDEPAVRQLLAEATDGGVLGPSGVNVTRLNLAVAAAATAPGGG